VLIAHTSDAMATFVGIVLVKAGFSPIRGSSGAEALRLLTRHRPPAADTKVVLLASVYRHTAYKRRPTSLYGAHDYVEQHHVPDLLPTKLCALLDIDPSGVSALVEEGRQEVERASG